MVMPAMTFLPGIRQPEDAGCRLLRYMNFKKFEWLIANNALYMCQLARLQDGFEGSMPLSTKEEFDRYFKESGVDPRSVIDATYPAWRCRKWHYVNCWSLGAHESAGLWRIFSTEDQGVAVETTYRALTGVFDKDDWIGLVQYINYERAAYPQISDFEMVMLKRKEFEYEKEVRVARRHIELAPDEDVRLPRHPDGFLDMHSFESFYHQPQEVVHKVDLSKLIVAVVVSPSADEKFFDKIQALVKSSNLSCPVNWSALKRRPILGT
jgi:hypothetical protein